MILLIVLSTLIYSLTIFSLIDFKESISLKLVISSSFSLSLLSLLYITSLFIGFSYNSFIVFLISLNVISIIMYNKTNLKQLLKLEIEKWTIFFIILIFFGTLLFWNQSIRWGAWDGWAIWNLHAKFLIYEESWTNLFDNKINWTHPDYPLMLPSMIAVFWKGSGSENVIAPILIAYYTFLSTCFLIYAAVAVNTRYKFINLFGVVLLILNANFMRQISYQYADSLLALFILLSIMLLDRKEDKSYTYFLLIGFFSSLPIWVKNEGIVFFILLSTLIIYQNIKNKGNILFFIIGTMPIMIVYSYFKIMYAPQNDITGGIGSTTLEKILDIDRYLIIIKYLTTTFTSKYPILLLLFTVIIILRPKAILSWKSYIIFSTLMAYLFVYIITPNDLEWHLKTSLDRLIHQLYPTCIYSGLIVVYKYKLVPDFLNKKIN